jgi:hypothetical protein
MADDSIRVQTRVGAAHPELKDSLGELPVKARGERLRQLAYIGLLYERAMMAQRSSDGYGVQGGVSALPLGSVQAPVVDAEQKDALADNDAEEGREEANKESEANEVLSKMAEMTDDLLGGF